MAVLLNAPEPFPGGTGPVQALQKVMAPNALSWGLLCPTSSLTSCA